jgi:hypothetical protein
MDDLSTNVPVPRQVYPRASGLASAYAWRERVQFVVLLQIAEQGCADVAALAAIVPGTDQGDLMEAVEDLLDHGLLQGRAEPLGVLDNLVAHGWLLMTSTGRRWLDADVAWLVASMARRSYPSTAQRRHVLNSRPAPSQLRSHRCIRIRHSPCRDDQPCTGSSDMARRDLIEHSSPSTAFEVASVQRSRQTLSRRTPPTTSSWRHSRTCGSGVGLDLLA